MKKEEKSWYDGDKFKELSTDEFEALEEAHQKEYLNDLRAEKEAKQKELEEAVKTKADASTVADLEKKLSKLTESQNETLVKELNRQGAEIKSLKEKQKDVEGEEKAPRTLFGAIVKELKSRVEDLKAMAEGTKRDGINFKVAALTTTANVSGAEIQPAITNAHEAGITDVTRSRPFIMDFVDMGSTNAAQITWTEKKNPDGDAAFVSEGGAKPLIDFDLVVDESNAREVAESFKVTKVALKDVIGLAQEINNELITVHDRKLEDGILNGDGIAPNLDGIINQAPAYIGSTSLSETVADANNYDAIHAAITQVVVSSDGWFIPNVVFVNPTDYAAMNLSKTGDSQYVLPPFVVRTANGEINVAGVRVVQQVRITQDFFLLGDFTKSHVRTYEPLSIEMGFENDDFTKNLVTLRASSRVHHYIKSNEVSAFVYDQFSVVKADLDPAVA